MVEVTASRSTTAHGARASTAGRTMVAGLDAVTDRDRMKPLINAVPGDPMSTTAPAGSITFALSRGPLPPATGVLDRLLTRL